MVFVALLFGGLTYAVRVSGLELPTPSGVPLVLVETPIGGPMPASDRSLYSRAFELAEEHPRDLGHPGYDWRRNRVVVNVATSRGEQLGSELEALDETHARVRVGALSVADVDRITEIALDQVDPVFATGYDGVNDRVVLRTNRIRGVLGRVSELFDPGEVAVVYNPFEEPPRMM